MKYNCNNCGKPTVSHQTEDGYYCHDCIVADGGEKETGGKTQNWLGKEPRPEEFKKFDKLLREGMPDGYEPHYFKAQPGSKAPKLGISWKSDQARLTTEEALTWLRNGGNVGVAGMEDGPLVNMDIDGGDAPPIDDVKASLKTRSRSREPETGHIFYKEAEGADIPNITTADSGEIRCRGEYVIAPGSYVRPDPAEDIDGTIEEAFEDGIYEADVPDDEIGDAGYYTVHTEDPVSDITLRELPRVFIETLAWGEYRKKKQKEAKEERKKRGGEPETVTSGDNKSAVFDLDIRDIVSTEGGSTNPTDRWSALFHGSDTDANMSVSDRGLLHCWRHQTTHGPLQTLAVLSDETASGNRACVEVGSGHGESAHAGCRLDTGELVWAAWKYAKKRGFISSGDPIPSSALKHVATRDGIVTPDEIIDDWKLPFDAYSEALEHIEDQYGVESGRSFATSDHWDTEGDVSAGVVLAKVQHGDDGGRKITKDELRGRVLDAIVTAITEDRNMVIDAIMSGGKTYGTFKAAHDIDEPVSYFAPRLDMYEQAVEYCEEIGIPRDEIKVLPSMKRHCPTWDGQHGEEWAKRVKRLYYAGAQPKVIHEMLDDIPCRDETEEGGEKCPYEAMWEFEPDDYRVIVGHYKHAHIPHVTAGRTCVFDEEPTNAFETTLAGEQLITAVNTFLDMDVSPPVEDFTDLMEMRNDRRRVKECMRWFNQMEQQDEFDFTAPDSGNVIALDGEGYHGYAPHAVYAILNTEPVAEGSNFERGFMPNDGPGTLFFTSSDQRGEYYVQFRESPNLEYANCVLALDGTPLTDESKPEGMRAREWQQSLGVSIEHNRILTNAERHDYIRNTLDHRYVQVSNSSNPYSSGRYNNMTEDASLCAAAAELYGDGEPGVVFTPKKVEDEYRDAGWVSEGIAKEIDHPGNIRGTDKYGTERLAVQLGSTHHGDHEIRRRAAWLHADVEVSGKGMGRDYGSDLANSILHQMRENQTAQNVMRVGRDGKGATVVLKTAAIPDYFPVIEAGAVTQWPKGMEEVLIAWDDISPSELKTIEVSEVAGNEHVDVGQRQVRNALDKFVDLGYAKKMDHPEDGRKNVYVDDGLSDIDPDKHAEVELPELDWPDEQTGEELGIEADSEIRVTNIYTSDFDKSPPSVDDGPETGVQIGVGDVTGDMDRGDPPTE